MNIKISAVLIIAFLLTACGSRDDGDRSRVSDEEGGTNEALAERGQHIFRNSDFGKYGVACADCHADYDETLSEETRIRPGHSILGAHRRAKTWNGAFAGEELAPSAAGAARCAHLYQGRGNSEADALTREEADALMAFYAYVSTGKEPLLLEWNAVTWPGDTAFSRDAMKLLVEDIGARRANPTRGEEMYKRACAPCHSTGIAPAQRMLKRNIVRNVRAGTGAMPFFSRDKLSDQDIADIKAFLE